MPKTQDGQTDGPATLKEVVSLTYEYAMGDVAAKFMRGLKDGKLLATRCSTSGLTYLPPRAFCDRSFAPCDEWVEAGTEGVIEQSTIDFRGLPGKRKPPVAMGFVRLDGVDTAIASYIDGIDLTDIDSALKSIAPGTRVRVQFAEERVGSVMDFGFVLANDHA